MESLAHPSPSLSRTSDHQHNRTTEAFFTSCRRVTICTCGIGSHAACLPYQYIVLLGLWHLKSFTKPLDNLAEHVATPRGAETSPDVGVYGDWHTYLHSIEKDVNATLLVCGQILTCVFLLRRLLIGCTLTTGTRRAQIDHRTPCDHRHRSRCYVVGHSICLRIRMRGKCLHEP